MKFSEKIKKAMGSAIFWYVAVSLFGTIILQANYPKMSWLQLLVVGIFILAILLIVIAAGFKTTEQITSKKTLGELGNDDDEEGGA